MKKKLAMVDLDGTLFDTSRVNFLAYEKALRKYGFSLDYNYFVSFCNGRHYLDFLPPISTADKDVLNQIHDIKCAEYHAFLDQARINQPLIDILKGLKKEYNLAVVTTASKNNCDEILEYFKVKDLFDLIVTKEDVKKVKPDPEGFEYAINHFGVPKSDCIIFEDSAVGMLAAENAQVNCYLVKGF